MRTRIVHSLIAFYLILTVSAEAKNGSKAATFSGEAPAPTSPLALWYRQPAFGWKAALPIGNGRLGAMIFGGVSHERICLNEVSLWSGAPIKDFPEHNLADQIPEVRRLLFVEKTTEAEELLWRIIQPSSGLHASHFGNSEILGYLNIESAGQSAVSNYRRSLDLDQAVARGGFEVGMTWDNAKLETATVKSLSGSPCRIRYGSLARDIDIQKGETTRLDDGLK